MATWQTVSTVRSASVKNKVYRVQVHARTGKVRCVSQGKTCLGFKYSPVKWCRHLERALPAGR